MMSGQANVFCRVRHIPWLLVLFGYLVASAMGSDQWSRFRGPNGAGLGEATTVPTTWSESDYNWHITLPGGGHSSPVLWDDLLVVTCGDEKTGARTILGFDSGNGSRRWSTRFTASTHRKHKLNSFASSTPALDELGVYCCWGTPDSFIVVALNHQGTELWQQDLGPFRAGHGDGVSPIVYGDLVVVAKEHNGQSELVALDRRTGEVRWRVDRESRATYSTPCVFRRKDGNEDLIFASWEHGITALVPATGELRWQADVFDKGHVECSIGSPVVVGDLIIGCSGYLAVRQEVVAVRLDTSTDQAERQYCIDRGAPLCTTPLVYGDLLFLWADEGIVTCADVHSGQVHWRRRVGGAYYASPIVVSGSLINVSADGDVVVLAAKDKYQPLGRTPLGEPSHSTPAVSRGTLYLRTVSQLFSLGGASK